MQAQGDSRSSGRERGVIRWARNNQSSRRYVFDAVEKPLYVLLLIIYQPTVGDLPSRDARGTPNDTGEGIGYCSPGSNVCRYARRLRISSVDRKRNDSISAVGTPFRIL